MSGYQLPTGALVVRTGPRGDAFYEAKWRWNGAQVKRRIGSAWLEPDDEGGWRPRRGRVPEGHFDEKRATVRMAALVAEHAETEQNRARADSADETATATFREVASAWLEWLKNVRGAKPSTLRDYGYLLAEPGLPHARGPGVYAGRVITAFGDRAAADISTRDASQFLSSLDGVGLSARNVNKHRQMLAAIFAYAMRDDTFQLQANPVTRTDKRKEPPAAALDFYEPQEVEALAAAAADGRHRTAPISRRGNAVSLADEEIAARAVEDAQDAEMFRLLAYTGLRLGEALALRWADVDLSGRRLTVQRAVSANTEGPTKSWQVRYVPLADAAHGALARLHARGDFTQRGDYVFCGRLGRRMDASPVRRRFHAARSAAGLRRLKLHELRHGAGSLVARETDAVFVQHFLGHSRISTTERYMHAKARLQDVERLNDAFAVSRP